MSNCLAGWLILCGVGVSCCRADVRLPAIISDHMVIQRELPARIWGWANPGEKVTVGFQEQKVSAVADSSGRWHLFLEPVTNSAAADLVIVAGNHLTVHDVAVGEVWVASGQSNMGMTLKEAAKDQAIAEADFPGIRFFRVLHKVADQPLEDVEGEWEICTPEKAARFSATAFFFARYLQQHIKTPLGIVQSAWGGSMVRSWLSAPFIDADPGLHFIREDWARTMAAYPAAKLAYDQAFEEWQAAAKAATAKDQKAPRRPQPPEGPGHHHRPSGLFNAMLAPLTPFIIRGVIWYQGETEAMNNQSSHYARMFESMILDWRRHWGLGSLPFLYVQLPGMKRGPKNEEWRRLRDAQAQALELTATAMVVTIDLGDTHLLHPKTKEPVGERLGRAARVVAYHEPITDSGPVVRQVAPAGSYMRLFFDHSAGLRTCRSNTIEGFFLAGADHQFHRADARIEGNSVVVSTPDVPEPVAVRYAWEDVPVSTLCNHEGLPAAPFRSDQWINAPMPPELP